MPDGTYNQRRIFPEDSGTGEEDKKKIHQRNKWKNNGNAIKSVVRSFCSIAQLLSNIRYFELKKPKTGMPKKDRCCPSAKKEGYSVAELTDIQNELR